MGLSRLLRILCCVLGLLPGARVCAQALQRQSFTTDDGLPQNSVHAILQTTDGYLWAATEGGVVRFDGVAFQRFDSDHDRAFVSNDACCLAQTRDGSLWIGTSDGLVRWSGSGFDHVAAGPVLQLAADPAGGLLALSAQGLLRVDALQPSPLVLPGGREATALGTAADGTPLVIAGTTLFRLQHRQFQLVGTLPAAATEVLEDAAHRLWLRSASEVWSVAPSLLRHWRVGSDLPGSRVLSLSDAGGAVFVGTNRGVYRLSAGTQDLQAIPELEGVSALTAVTDREGDLWIGTDTSGLIVLRTRAVESVPSLANDTITSVVQTQDSALWAGTRDSGLKQVPGTGFTTLRVPAALAHGLILSLAAGVDGDLWIGTSEGLTHLDRGGRANAVAADGLPDDFIRSLLSDGPGAVWAGTRHGVAHLLRGVVDRVLTTADGMPSDVVGTMLRTQDGAVWFGTLRGLARLQNGTVLPVPFTGGDSTDGVTALVQAPGGRLLAGTHGGRFVFAKDGRYQSVRVGGVHGEVDALLLDQKNNVWVRTPAGVQRLALADLLRCHAGAACNPLVRTFGTADGMPSVDSSADGHPSAWRATDGVLWFATRHGLARIDAGNLAIDLVPPPVVIEAVQVDGVAFSPKAALRLGPGHRRLVFDYAALSLRAPFQVAYRFKLEGFDRDWIDAGNRRSAEYTNLPPGTYRLLVDARNADGTPSAAPATLDIRIDAPLYRRWWFYVLLLLLAAAAVYAVYRLRLRRVEREFNAVLQERNRIAREIHDTLAQDFVAVSLQLEVTAQLLKMQATDAAQQQIEATRLLVRDGIGEARDSIWALRAGQSAGDLPARLRSMVQAAPQSPVHSLGVSGSFRALAPSVEKELLRIAKEAMGNADRHAHADRIEVLLLYSEDAVSLTVRDDGAGFDVESGKSLAGHYGLRGMSERASAIAATLHVSSTVGVGTTVTLRLNT